MVLAFVYGTLKKGFPNNYLLEDTGRGSAKFISSGQTVDVYPMVVLKEAYNIPFVLDKPGIGKNVCGEVWEVDTKMLECLDALENHPSWYTRTNIDIKTSNGVLSCGIYLLKDFKEELLNEEFVSNYKEEYTELFIPPSKRKNITDLYKMTKQG